MVQLKEEHTLLSCFLITTRKRHEADLERSIGNYMFAVVPKSIFTPDSQLLHSFGKAKILHPIKALVKGEEANVDETNLDTAI